MVKIVFALVGAVLMVAPLIVGVTVPTTTAPALIRPSTTSFWTAAEVFSYATNLIARAAAAVQPNIEVVPLNVFGRSLPEERTTTPCAYLYKLKPYAKNNIKNPRRAKNRPVISIESGFEANNQMSDQIAYLFVDYLLTSCTGQHCLYDYLIFPTLVGCDAVEYARTTDTTWVKTRNANAGTTALGTNLLENFDGGDWANGNSDPSSPLYRGSAVGSAPQTKYQIYKNSFAKNLKLSVTLTKKGGKLSHPHAYSTSVNIAQVSTYTTLLQAYKSVATTYTIGSYANNHGVNRGHPMDYNFKKYKDSYSINVALGGNSNTDIAATFKTFLGGMKKVLEEWKKQTNFKLEYY